MHTNAPARLTPRFPAFYATYGTLLYTNLRGRPSTVPKSRYLQDGVT